MDANLKGVTTFRRMQHADIQAVLTLSQSGLTYGDLAASDPDSPLAMSFVAEVEKRIIGFILARAHFVGIPISEVCIIHAIAVSPEYQGHGIGTQLLGQLQSKCENEDIHIMRILVPQNNSQLRQYISSMGFRQSYLINFDKVCGGEG